MPATLQDIRESFTLAGGASTLTPKIIDRLLMELQRKYGPMYRAFPRKTWETDIYYFNQRTALPKSQFTVEAPGTSGTGSVTASDSTYVQQSFPIKHTQAQIDISTFAAKVAVVNGNLFDLELLGAAKSMEWLEETTHMWGSASATLNTYRPQWDGNDLLIASANKIDAKTNLLTLQNMDNAIDAVRGVYAAELGTDFFFAMSPRMQSYLNGLFVNQQRFNMGMTKIFTRNDYGDPGATVADSAVDLGIECQTYRSIPIVISSFIGSQGSMTTVTTTNNTGSGSSLSTSTTYYYVVEAVTRYGLTTASAEVSTSPNGSGNNIVLSWTTPTPKDAYGNTIDIIGYRVFRGTASGGESLYAVVAAYDTSDNAVTSFTDTGLIQNPAVTNTLYWATVASSSTNAASDGVTFPRIQTGSQVVEDIFLIPRDPEILVIPEVNPITTQMLAPINARTRQFALTADKTMALRAPAFAAKIERVRCA
jgi:hypothetical protein